MRGLVWILHWLCRATEGEVLIPKHRPRALPVSTRLSFQYHRCSLSVSPVLLHPVFYRRHSSSPIHFLQSMGVARLLLLAAGLLVGSISVPTMLLMPAEGRQSQILAVDPEHHPVLPDRAVRATAVRLRLWTAPSRRRASRRRGRSSFKLQAKFYYVVDGNATVEQRCIAGTCGRPRAPGPAQGVQASCESADRVPHPNHGGQAQRPHRAPAASVPRTLAPPGEDRKDGLSVGTIAAISVVSIVAAGALFWLLCRRRTRERRLAERRPTRDWVVDPPPAYLVQPAFISADEGSVGAGRWAP